MGISPAVYSKHLSLNTLLAGGKCLEQPELLPSISPHTHLDRGDNTKPKLSLELFDR